MYQIDLSIIIPVYRSQETIEELCNRVYSTLKTLNLSFEILFVEDCGGDDSWNIIQTLANNHSNVRGIKLARNYGQHNALLCGIRAAYGKIIVTCDDDLQNPPEEIPKLLSSLKKDVDVVYGSPAIGTHGVLRNLASRITKLVLNDAMGADTANKVSAFRAFRAHLRNSFAEYRGPSVNIDVLLTWGTTRFTAVTVRQNERAVGMSGYSFRKLTNHAINMMTGFTTLPLQMASIAGFLFGIFGLLLLLYVVGRYLVEGSSVPGFPFLASIIVIFSAVQLMALGVFGEYLARIHFRSMERPSYTIFDETNKINDNES